MNPTQLFLTALLGALPVAPALAATCEFTTQEIRATLPDAFSLRLRAHPAFPPPSAAAWDGAALTLAPSRTGFSVGVLARGSVQPLTLTEGTLAAAKNGRRAVAVTLEPRGRPRWLRVAFSRDTRSPRRTEYGAATLCVAGVAETVVRPVDGRGMFGVRAKTVRTDGRLTCGQSSASCPTSRPRATTPSGPSLPTRTTSACPSSRWSRSGSEKGDGRRGETVHGAAT